MKHSVQVFAMAIAFDLYWTLVVVFRERGLFLWLALAILAFVMLSPAHRLYALLLATAGSGLAGTDAVFPHFDGETTMRTALLMLFWLTTSGWGRKRNILNYVSS